MSKNDEREKAAVQSLLKCLKHAAPVAHIRTQELEGQNFPHVSIWMSSEFETNFLKLDWIYQIRCFDLLLSALKKLLNLKKNLDVIDRFQP